MIKKN